MLSLADKVGPSHYQKDSDNLEAVNMKVTLPVDNSPRLLEDSVERALNEVSDRWSFLLLREAFFGVRRFDQFQRAIGVSPNILTDRLKKLVTAGIFERRRYSDHPPRDEYHLTVKGLDLYPAIVALMRWGDRWLNNSSEPPLTLVHKKCGNDSKPLLVCDCCGEEVAARDMTWRVRASLE